MDIIPKYEELGKLSDQELIAGYNAQATHTVVGTGFYLDELVRREQARQTKRILELTKTIRNLTFTITVLTVVNVLLVAKSIFNG